jgi:hypothetical protein
VRNKLFLPSDPILRFTFFLKTSQEPRFPEENKKNCPKGQSSTSSSKSAAIPQIPGQSRLTKAAHYWAKILKRQWTERSHSCEYFSNILGLFVWSFSRGLVFSSRIFRLIYDQK